MSRPSFRNSILIAILAVFFTAGATGAEDAVREPIVITSNRMEAEKLNEKVTFIGNVNLKKENMTLSSDTMVVLYDEGTKDVREVQAAGNVVVRKEGSIAYANKAFYYSKEEKIILIGEARIIENDNQLDGEKITLYLKDDRSIVEGGKVLLYQEKSEPLKDRKKPR